MNEGVSELIYIVVSSAGNKVMFSILKTESSIRKDDILKPEGSSTGNSILNTESTKSKGITILKTGSAGKGDGFTPLNFYDKSLYWPSDKDGLIRMSVKTG